jgi:uncharacterized coiled-coil protein SlyX
MRAGMLNNMALFSIILLLALYSPVRCWLAEGLNHASPMVGVVYAEGSASEESCKNNCTFTIKLIDLLRENRNPVLSFKMLFPNNNTERIVAINNIRTFVNQRHGIYYIKPNHNDILTNTSYFYINKTNQIINIGYVNYSSLIMKMDRLTNRIADLSSRYNELKRTIDEASLHLTSIKQNVEKGTENLTSIMQNTMQIRGFTYTALSIAIVSIILITVNMRRTLYRLKRIEEYIKNIVEDTEIE